MRIKFAGLLAASAVISIGCGGSSGGTPTAPTAPSAPAAQPAAVNVGGGPSTPAGWAGSASDDQLGSGIFSLSLHQTGTQVTGGIFVLGHSGTFTGTVSGNALVFHFNVNGENCTGSGDAISGTATVSSVNTMTARPNTMNTMTATFSGKDCAGGPVTNGTFAASYSDPTNSATRFPLAGTWTGFAPPPLGGGSWTWTLAQNGDVNGGNLTGSVTFSNGNTSNLGVGTITGTFTNVFQGPPEWISAVTNVSFTGACPATLTVTWGEFGNLPTSFLVAMSQDGLHLTAASFSGSTCNGPLPAAIKPGLTRQ